MGGNYSSPVPVALDELTQPYIVTPRLTREFYNQHLAGQPLEQDKRCKQDFREKKRSQKNKLIGLSIHQPYNA